MPKSWGIVMSKNISMPELFERLVLYVGGGLRRRKTWLGLKGIKLQSYCASFKMCKNHLEEKMLKEEMLSYYYCILKLTILFHLSLKFQLNNEDCLKYFVV